MKFLKNLLANALARAGFEQSDETSFDERFKAHVAYFRERLAFNQDYLTALEAAQVQQAEFAALAQKQAEEAEQRGDAAAATRARSKEVTALAAIALLARDVVTTRTMVSDLEAQIAVLTGTPRNENLADALNPA